MKEIQNTAREGVLKNTDNKLVEENKFNSPSEAEVQEQNQNYIETERSEEIWKGIMQSYHMGEGIQGIFNGCRISLTVGRN